MTFRTKLVVVILLLVAGSVGFVGWAVSSATRDSFERLDAQRTTALVEQFRREFTRRGREIELRVAGIADVEATLRMALDLNREQPDYALYVSDALGLSKSHQLDFLELVATDGTIVSSAHWPGRFGSKNEWVAGADWGAQGPFLMREELPDGSLALGLMAVRTVRVGESALYIIGGRRVDREFLASFPLPEGMRALLYRNLSPDFRPGELTDVAGPIEDADRLAQLIESLRQEPVEKTESIRWDASDPASEEVFHAIPLLGRQKELLGVLLAGSSRRQVVELLDAIRGATLAAGGIGIAFGVLLSWWAATRVTRPVEQLADMTRQVAAGRWDVRADARGHDEVADLARAFNYMTAQLAEQRQRLVQAERVAAWRELARRLAHELKNPLFPLQITVENLQRAREQNPEQFDEVFQESCATLLAELDNLKTIVGRFSDFAKMPRPEPQPTDVNDLVRSAVRLFEPQFTAVGQPQILPEMYLDEDLDPVHADPDLLRQALSNLVLNAMDAMPAGGSLIVRTARVPAEKGRAAAARIEVEDTGTGLTPEECERLFTPYYTSKRHGTGLGLAIVQSVISDHGGRITVQSAPGEGTLFRIELPLSVTAAAKEAKRKPQPSPAAAPPAEEAEPAVAAAEEQAPSEEEPVGQNAFAFDSGKESPEGEVVPEERMADDPASDR